MRAPIRHVCIVACITSTLALHPAVSAHAIERTEVGNLVMDGMPPIPEEISERLQQYHNTRSAALQGWLSDGSGMLISTRFGDTSQIHRVDMPGGARHQLTFFTEPVGGAAINPNPEHAMILLTRDEGGSELYQIFAMDMDSGRTERLTDGISRNGAPVWSNDGSRFVYFTTRRNGRDWDLHILDLATKTSTPVLETGGTWFPGPWSPDDSHLLATRYVSANENHPHILDVETGELTPLGPAETPIAYGAAVWAANGAGLFYTSDEDSEFRRLRYRDLETGATTVITEEIPWDVGSLEISPDRSILAFTVNADGIDELHLLDTATLEALTPPQLPPGVIYGLDFSPDGSQLGLVLNSSTSPGDVYSAPVDATGATGSITRWTFSEVGGLDPGSFVSAKLIRYPTFDRVAPDGERRTIPAFYYRPEGEGPFPVVIDIHGGPEGQERPTFSPQTQYMVAELDVAILAPNVRGSAGYGKSYLKLDNAMLREDSVADIGALLDWIESRPELDADRVAVMGGSYGGYMVLASMVHFNDRLRAGIDIVGISSFVTFLENTNPYRRDLRRVEYGDERDPEMREFLEKISPLNRASAITKPLFVIQGLNDPRVPASEAEQIVEAVRTNDNTVWYLLAKDEGHGFRKKSNRDVMYDAIAHFINLHLLPETNASAP